MPAKGTKLSSSQKKARAAKAAATRKANKVKECKAKCVASGGAACSSGRKKKSPKRKSAAKKAIPDALQPWMNFLAHYRQDSNLKGKAVMIEAGEVWRGLSAAEKKQFS